MKKLELRSYQKKRKSGFLFETDEKEKSGKQVETEGVLDYNDDFYWLYFQGLARWISRMLRFLRCLVVVSFLL